MPMSLFGGAFLCLDKDGTPVPLDDERFRTRGKSPCSAEGVSGSKIWRATWNIKASGKPANCSTGTIGAASEAQLALFKTSCESLHKK